MPRETQQRLASGSPAAKARHEKPKQTRWRHRPTLCLPRTIPPCGSHTHNCHRSFCNNQPALVARHGKRAPSARKRPALMAARRENATRRPQPASNDEDTKRQWCASTEINAHHCKPNPAPTTQRRGGRGKHSQYTRGPKMVVPTRTMVLRHSTAMW